MYAIGMIKSNISKQADVKAQMEEYLTSYILPEFDSPYPFMRSRACQTYCVYGNMNFKDNHHIQQIV